MFDPYNEPSLSVEEFKSLRGEDTTVDFLVLHNRPLAPANYLMAGCLMQPPDSSGEIPAEVVVDIPEEILEAASGG